MELNIVDLYRALFHDLGVDKYTASYCLTRVSNEGVHFVTTLLPSFSKHVLACIETGYWTAFSTSVKSRGGLPLIFRGYLQELFAYNDRLKKWVVRRDLDPVSLWVIRQACEYSFKLALPFSEADKISHAAKFVETDLEVLAVGDYDESFVDEMRQNLETYYPSVCRITERDLAVEARPGPGTYSGAQPNTWFFRNYKPATIPPEAIGLGFGMRFNKRAPNPSVDTLDPRWSEVLFVPKDSRGPRTIVREPYNLLQFQMGYNTCLARALEADTHNRVNFADQGVNQRLAQLSSITRNNATIDLKDASDRVSFAIVKHLYRYLPLGKLLRFRSGKVRIRQFELGARDPSPYIWNLRKLAGMGSGYTFPTMALVIHLAICTMVTRHRKVSYQNAMSRVYVYGDDIICPTDWYDLAVKGLSQVGLAVNLQKSYRRSHFRESCGGDYYYGNDVAPVRLKLASAGPRIESGKRYLVSFDNRDFALLDLERHARELTKKQLHSAAAFLYKFLSKELGPLPYVSGESPILGVYVTKEQSFAKLKTDEHGNYKSRTVWVSQPLKTYTRDACPYRYLGRQIGKDASPYSWDFLLPHPKWERWETFGRETGWSPGGSRGVFGVVPIPRHVVLVRREANGLALT